MFSIVEWVLYALLVSEYAISVALIVVYCVAMSAINKVDLDLMNYFNDNQCSDGVLQHSIEKYMGRFENDRNVVAVGLGMSLIHLIALTLNTLLLGPMRCALKCCPRFRESFKLVPKLDRSITSLTESIRYQIMVVNPNRIMLTQS